MVLCCLHAGREPGIQVSGARAGLGSRQGLPHIQVCSWEGSMLAGRGPLMRSSWAGYLAAALVHTQAAHHRLGCTRLGSPASSFPQTHPHMHKTYPCIRKTCVNHAPTTLPHTQARTHATTHAGTHASAHAGNHSRKHARKQPHMPARMQAHTQASAHAGNRAVNHTCINSHSCLLPAWPARIQCVLT